MSYSFSFFVSIQQQKKKFQSRWPMAAECGVTRDAVNRVAGVFQGERRNGEPSGERKSAPRNGANKLRESQPKKKTKKKEESKQKKNKEKKRRRSSRAGRFFFFVCVFFSLNFS